MATAQTHTNRQTCSVEQAAEILGISRTSAYIAVRRGEIPCLRIGRRVVIPRAALDRLLGRDSPDPACLDTPRKDAH